MGRLFEVFLFHDRMWYRGSQTARVRWATESPLEVNPPYGRRQVLAEFHAMMREYDLVIHLHTINKCYYCIYEMGRGSIDQEAPRKQLVAAYKEAGLETDRGSMFEFSNCKSIIELRDRREPSEHFCGGA